MKTGLVLILVLGAATLDGAAVYGARRGDRRTSTTSTEPVAAVTSASSRVESTSDTPTTTTTTRDYSERPVRVGPRFGTRERYKSRHFTTPSPRDCGSACPQLSSPVCAGDVVTPPQTFSNSCQLERYNCRKRKNLEVIQDGPCDHPEQDTRKNFVSPRPTSKSKPDDRRNSLVVSA